MEAASSVEPFEARVEQHLLDDLVERLRRTRWPDRPPGPRGETGIALGDLRDLVEYWRNGFEWRAAEARLNRFSQFRATLGGGRVHFLHERGRGPRPFPLVITHGWPGSVFEMLELIPRLTDPGRFGGRAADSFDVVAPSLPGYGFSDPPAAPGMHPGRIAALWLELMDVLGYDRFGAQGGDWGASVATRLALGVRCRGAATSPRGRSPTSSPTRSASSSGRFGPSRSPAPVRTASSDRVQSRAFR